MHKILAALALIVAPIAALADSCWDHNGSLMRLTAAGQARTFLYEEPRTALFPSGVRKNTWLFSGQNLGDYYVGTARVFSRFCPDTPLEYAVEGPVLQNPLRVQVTGTREVFQQCRPTGRVTTDVLVFTYRFDC